MVVGYLHAHSRKHLVVALRRASLELGVFFTGAAHAVNYLAALGSLFEEAVNGIDVVLKVSVHRDNYVSVVHRRHHTCEQRILMTLVP